MTALAHRPEPEALAAYHHRPDPAGVFPHIPGCGPGKVHVYVQLTPWAPWCEHLRAEDARRNPHFFSVTPRRALAEVLHKIGKPAGEVSPRRCKGGETAVMSTRDPRLGVPMAFVYDLTFDQVAAALAELAAGTAPDDPPRPGWRL